MSTRSGVVNPARGEIWEVDLNPTVGREQSGRRPVLIVSDNALNSSSRGLVVVIPVTGTVRGLPTHILVSPPEGGLSKPSVMMTEQVRSYLERSSQPPLRRGHAGDDGSGRPDLCESCSVFDSFPRDPRVKGLFLHPQGRSFSHENQEKHNVR